MSASKIFVCPAIYNRMPTFADVSPIPRRESSPKSISLHGHDWVLTVTNRPQTSATSADRRTFGRMLMDSVPTLVPTFSRGCRHHLLRFGFVNRENSDGKR